MPNLKAWPICSWACPNYTWVRLSWTVLTWEQDQLLHGQDTHVGTYHSESDGAALKLSVFDTNVS